MFKFISDFIIALHMAAWGKFKKIVPITKTNTLGLYFFFITLQFIWVYFNSKIFIHYKTVGLISEYISIAFIVFFGVVTLVFKFVPVSLTESVFDDSKIYRGCLKSAVENQLMIGKFYFFLFTAFIFEDLKSDVGIENYLMLFVIGTCSAFCNVGLHLASKPPEDKSNYKDNQ